MFPHPLSGHGVAHLPVGARTSTSETMDAVVYGTPNIIGADRSLHRAYTAGGFGAVAGIFALFFFSDIPKVRKDIMQVRRRLIAARCPGKRCADEGDLHRNYPLSATTLSGTSLLQIT